MREGRREGRGHKLGAEETGVNRIFNAGHSLSPLCFRSPLHPSASNHSTAPPPPKQSPGQGLKAGCAKEKHKYWGRASWASLR